MPTAVRNVFINLLEKFGQLSHEASKNILEMKECQGTYQTETWT